MARGSTIVVNGPDVRGKFVEGTIIGTPKPGTIMEMDMTASPLLTNGRFSYRVYQPGTDGERRTIFVLREDDLQGKLATDAYVTGTRGFLYVPVPGDELNCLVANLSGTADDHTAGETMIVDTGTGLLIATTGSPESEPFRLLETITDPTADTLAWVQYTGY